MASFTSKDVMKLRFVTSSSSPFWMTSMYSQRTARGMARARSATKKPAPFRTAIRTIVAALVVERDPPADVADPPRDVGRPVSLVVEKRHRRQSIRGGTGAARGGRPAHPPKFEARRGSRRAVVSPPKRRPTARESWTRPGTPPRAPAARTRRRAVAFGAEPREEGAGPGALERVPAAAARAASMPGRAPRAGASRPRRRGRGAPPSPARSVFQRRKLAAADPVPEEPLVLVRLVLAPRECRARRGSPAAPRGRREEADGRRRPPAARGSRRVSARRAGGGSEEPSRPGRRACGPWRRACRRRVRSRPRGAPRTGGAGPPPRGSPPSAGSSGRPPV